MGSNEAEAAGMPVRRELSSASQLPPVSLPFVVTSGHSVNGTVHPAKST
jgi:hypothetical protein